MRFPGALVALCASFAASAEPQPSCDTPQACEALCKKGEAPACGTLGMFLLYTANTPQRRAVALKAFLRACDGSEPTGCEYAARMLADGANAKDPQRARTLADRGCRLGGQKACALAAVILAARPTDKPFDDAPNTVCDEVKDCTKKCDADLPHACHMLGLYHSFALQGAVIDVPRARTMLLRSCELNDAEACHAAAALLHFGQGGPADEELSAELRIRGCDLGLADACSKAAEQLGQLKKDPKRAKALLKRACKLRPSDC